MRSADVRLRNTFLVIGVLLISIYIIVFLYVVGAYWLGIPITQSPFIQYALPSGALGLIILFVSLFALPVKNEPRAIPINTIAKQFFIPVLFCPICRKLVDKNARSCPHCGCELA